MKRSVFICIGMACLISCHKRNDQYDASGSFEAVEIIISAEASGILREFTVEEGKDLSRNQYVGVIDTTQLYLKKRQLQSQIRSVLAQEPDIPVQLASLESQLNKFEKEKKRFTRLVRGGAAAQKQLDDINAQIDLIHKQMQSQKSSLQITKESIESQTEPLNIQIEQIADQISKSRIINPVKGTVLVKYAEPNEITVAGKPLYKIADLSSLILRAYVTGSQLPDLKLNQKVKVLVNYGEISREYPGEIEWISSKAEFTPKTIQTREEKTNLVYAIKIRVKNDGSLKIGMYGDVILFQK